MILYEVNLTVEASIYTLFSNWIQEHIQEMLEIKGFVKANLFEVIEPESTDYHLSIQYEVETIAHLEHYFQHHAAIMHQKGNDRFGAQIKVSRRILRYKNQQLKHLKSLTQSNKSIH